jgi:nucleoside-diphosphate kinase
MEKTYIMTKPDAYKRKILGKIISRIEDKGYNIVKMQMMTLTEEQLKEHYAHIADRPFFKDILAFMTSAPVVAMVVEGNEVVKGMRILMGPTQWYDALPGTIRGDFCNFTGENIIHGSDSVENAEIEIKRFFN